MPRIAPVMPSESPGNFNTGALFNATMKAVGDWQINVPRFKGFSATTQAIGSSTTFASLALDSEIVDSDGGHSTVTNTSRYVCQVAGSYWAQGTCSLPTSATGNRSMQLAVNGSTLTGSTILQAAPSGNSWFGVTSAFAQLSVGDYVEVQVWQNSGGSLSTNVAAGLQPTLSLFWVSN